MVLSLSGDNVVDKGDVVGVGLDFGGEVFGGALGG